MTMVFNDEQLMLRDSAAEFLSSKHGVDSFRKARDENGVVTVSADAWQAMVELGWSAILVPEELDGLGFGMKGLGAVTIEAGRNLVASHITQTSGVGVAALLACEASDERDHLVQKIAVGEVITSCTTLSHANFVAEGSTATHLLMVNELGIDVFDLEKALGAESRGLIDCRDYVDFDRQELEVSFSLKFAEKGAKDYIELVGALLTACELYGLSSESFGRTLAYLKEREQFGQKIGSFQALQHRMAHAYMELEMFKSVLLDALDAMQSQRKDIPLAVSHAKLLANDVSQRVCTEAIQLHGGMGITDELDIGLFYKRARVLRTTYGSSAWHKQHCAELSGL